MRIRAAFLVILALMGSWVSAAEIRKGSPARYGFSDERLANITSFMEAKVEEGTLVGGMGLIARDGKIIYQQTYGMADREAGRPMESDTIFRIYSMTKPITTVALMMLFEEGKFKLNDPIAKYMPELANLQVALSTADTGSMSDGIYTRSYGEIDASLLGQTRKPARQPTVRDLMLHTAGLPMVYLAEPKSIKCTMGYWPKAIWIYRSTSPRSVSCRCNMSREPSGTTA